MTSDFAHYRELACTLAEEAMAMLAHAPASADVIVKAPGDWCSALDTRIEQHLKQRIARSCPGHRVWGEETHDSSAAHSLASGPVWVIDPIDGSMNFLRGYPQYAVSIALLEDGQPVAACIADPVRREVFSAAAGLGAECNGQPLRCSTTARLPEALGATVFPKPGARFMAPYLQELGLALNGTAGLRRSGAMALELAYLAAGRVDVFWERGMGPWDAAAGWLLIHEAGGQLWSLDGLDWHQSRALAASNAALRSDWHRLLCSAAERP